MSGARRHTGRRRACVGALVGLVGMGVSGTTRAFAVPAGPPVAVIVEAQSVAAAARAVASVGGTVETTLPLVNGVAAEVDADRVTTLRAGGTVRVVPDLVLQPTSASFGDGSVDSQVAALDPGADATPDAGRGVTVALVDTGVAVTPDLRGNRLVRGPDLSGENDGIDHYGHGTFMAGLIAGDGSASAATTSHHTGIAPGARVVSVKVARADGSTTVSRVIAGIGWVVVHRDAYDIRVLSLSFGVDAPMRYVANPLDAAVEAAWASGITVVAAAGNDGSDGVSSPGDDPYVVTAGATDTGGTPQSSDDVVPSWSSHERFRRYAKPDVVAPGVSVVSLRAPGSTIDVAHPEGRVGAEYFRGSGTSMSTALVAGAAAVVVAHHPDATPDDVKGALVDGASTTRSGARAVDIAGAVDAPARPGWWQHFPVAMHGLGFHYHDGMPWSASRWKADAWNASRWKASRWKGASWTETAWSASRWKDVDFAASRWKATRWTALAWPALRWG